MSSRTELHELINSKIASLSFGSEPKELYEPMTYFLSLGGKRMRPLLTLMACELFGGSAKTAIFPALGIELFHNFTLLHDDIMDRSPLRRSKPTVNNKWNDNIAILSGDAMFVKSCSMMMSCPASVVNQVMEVFLSNALKVCEGQQFDMNYENEKNISIDRYLKMIELKTAVLLGASLQIGALVAGASPKDSELLFEFGKNIGIAFQLQDDILDVYGDEEKFGKQKGRDIVSNKKTFLLIKALELAKGSADDELNKWLEIKNFNESVKVSAVTGIYDSLRVKDLAQEKMKEYFDLGIRSFESLKVDQAKKEELFSFAGGLMFREV